MCPQISALVWFKAKKAIHLVKCYSKFAKILVNTHDLACWYFDIQPSTPLKKGKLRRQETRCADLHELHEEVDVLGVELLAEVVDGLVHVLRQRVLLAAPDEVALPPDPLRMLPRRQRRSRRRRRPPGRRHLGGSSGLPTTEGKRRTARVPRMWNERSFSFLLGFGLLL